MRSKDLEIIKNILRSEAAGQSQNRREKLRKDKIFELYKVFALCHPTLFIRQIN